MVKKQTFEIRDRKIDKVIQKINQTRMKDAFYKKNPVEQSKELNPYYKKLKSLKKKQLEVLKKKIKNKQFYYTTKKNPRRYGGSNVTATIFKNTRKGLKNVGETKWQTAGYRGDESEILNELVKKKLLPKEVLTVSKSANSGGGYYGSDIRDELGVKIRGI